LPTLVAELKALAINYTKQETLEPVKALGRYLAFGVAGSLMLAIGLTLWVIAGLRALQEETGSMFTGHLTWLPYLLTLVGTALVIGAAGYAVNAEKRSAERRKQRRLKESRLKEAGAVK
jgi:hypothetical protein